METVLACPIAAKSHPHDSSDWQNGMKRHQNVSSCFAFSSAISIVGRMPQTPPIGDKKVTSANERESHIASYSQDGRGTLHTQPK